MWEKIKILKKISILFFTIVLSTTIFAQKGKVTLGVDYHKVDNPYVYNFVLYPYGYYGPTYSFEPKVGYFLSDNIDSSKLEIFSYYIYININKNIVFNFNVFQCSYFILFTCLFYIVWNQWTLLVCRRRNYPNHPFLCFVYHA